MKRLMIMILAFMPLVLFGQDFDKEYNYWLGNYSFTECPRVTCPNFVMKVTRPETNFSQYEFELDGGAQQWMHYAKGYIFTYDYKRLDFYSYKDDQGFHEQGEYLFSLQLDCQGNIITYWYGLEISEQLSGQELIKKIK